MYENIDFDKIDITQNPPTKEPERQFYFIAKARKYVKAMSEKLGRPLTSVVVTFGCQMNPDTMMEQTHIKQAQKGNNVLDKNNKCDQTTSITSEKMSDVPWHNQGSMYCAGCTKRILNPSACRGCGVIAL